MSKAKVKITVTKGKKGTILARVPVAVVKNDQPSSQKIYQTKAQLTLRVKTTKGGKPRIKSRY